MPIDIAEAKAFIQSAEKARNPWLQVAKKSWAELKNRTSTDKVWSLRPSTTRKRYRYPAWYSIYKIRQPLILSRAGEPIGRDTTSAGTDPLGACAAILLERLAVNLAKTFDFYDVMCACRDDFLATNFSLCRAYYERDLIKEKVKQFLTYVPDEQGGGMFLDEQGKPVETDDVFQTEDGQYYIETNKIVDIENEKICLDAILYKDIFIDPVRRWGRVKRMAIRDYYSPAQFKEVFGMAAYRELKGSEAYKEALGDDAEKDPSIAVIEYWDAYAKEVIWFPEHGETTIEPLCYKEASEKDSSPYDDEVSKLNGLFNLEKFFPVPNPLIMNAPTDEFWPIPEYLQLQDWFDDIHSIFSKMVIATRAIRTRLIYDGSIPGLKAALDELAESDTIGVNNLTQALQASGGTLSAGAQYVPVEQVIGTLAQYYQALEQRLNQVYKLTGTSDLLQGLITDPTQRTFGERQMTEKYALNQLSEPQDKMQKFVRDCYQLITEMAVKNFKDESLERYCIPQTLPEDLRKYFPQALQLLKSNPQRFRVELETDSTIAINEEYDKAMRMELVKAMTAGLDAAANVAQSQPQLAAVDLHALKFMVQGFRQGKLFQEEITQAIDAVIESMAQPKPQAPDYEAEKLKLEQAKLQASYQTDQARLQADERLSMAKLNQDAQIFALQNQLAQFKAQMDQGKNISDLQLQYATLQSTITEAQQKLANDRDALMIEMQKVGNEQQIEQYRLMVEQQTKPFEAQLEAQRQQIDMYELELRRVDQAIKMQERQAIDTHTTTDNVLQEMRLQIDAQKLAQEARKQPELPPITINMPQPATTKKKVKVERDEMGNITNLATEDVQEPS